MTCAIWLNTGVEGCWGQVQGEALLLPVGRGRQAACPGKGAGGWRVREAQGLNLETSCSMKDAELSFHRSSNPRVFPSVTPSTPIS
jgi:hypothetical protein